MAVYHKLYHGGPITNNPNRMMYPAADIDPKKHLHEAAHKEPACFSNTRRLSFGQADMIRQAALQQYVELNPIAQGDTIGAACCPAQCLLWGYAWRVITPEAGVSLKLKLHFGGQSLATIDGTVAGSDCKPLVIPLWLPDNEILDLELTSWPANGVSALDIWVSPIIFVPHIGN